MTKKRYRVWLAVEEVEGGGAFDPRLVEQIELAAFETIEEALTYRHHLSRKCSPEMAGRSGASSGMAAPKAFGTSD